jgi:MFS family permease
MAGDHDPYAALRHPGYRLFLSGAVLASIGGEILAATVGWEIVKRMEKALLAASPSGDLATDSDLLATEAMKASAGLIGLAGLVQFLPVLLFALPAGQAADRFSRKVLVQLAQAMMTVAGLGLAVNSWFDGPMWILFACLVLAGCSRVLSMTSRNALVSQVVPLEHLGNAITWNSSGWQFANVAGPAIGGLVIGLGVPFAYLLTGSCCLACAGLLLLVRPREVSRPAETRSLSSLLAGVRFVWKTELLLAAITLDLFAVLLGGATALLPIYAKSILHLDAEGYGCMRAAPAIGALLMAIILTHRPLRRAGVALLAAVAGFGAATIVFGLSHNAWLSFAMLAFTGAFDNVSVVVRGTLMQLLTPDDMRGRVSAVNAIFISSSNELGAFESGQVAYWFGPVFSVVSGGVGTILVVVAVMLRWPLLRRLGPLRPGEVLPPELVGHDAGEMPPASV